GVRPVTTPAAGSITAWVRTAGFARSGLTISNRRRVRPAEAALRRGRGLRDRRRPGGRVLRAADGQARPSGDPAGTVRLPPPARGGGADARDLAAARCPGDGGGGAGGAVSAGH